MGLTSSVPNSILQPGVCTSTTRPAAPYQGQVVYETDTNKTLFYNGAAWVILNDPNAMSVDASGNVTFDNDVTVSGGATVSGDLTVTGNMTSANQGLVFIKSQTIGSGVSSVTVSNAFSSTFDNYIIAVNTSSSSVNCAFNFYLSGLTSLYKWVLNYSNYATSGSWIAGNTTSEWQYVGSCRTNGTSMIIPINGPALARPTSIGPVAYSDTGATGTMTGWNESATAYSGFVLAPSAGTLTGGSIRVYGYNNG